MGKRSEQRLTSSLLKVDYMARSGFLSVAVADLEPDASTRAFSLLLWDQKGAGVFSAHLCCALACPRSTTHRLHAFTRELSWTAELSAFSLHSPALSLPLSPPLSFSLVLLLFYLFFFSDRKGIVFGSNSFLSYHIRNFFLYCEIFSATREIGG